LAFEISIQNIKQFIKENTTAITSNPEGKKEEVFFCTMFPAFIKSITPLMVPGLRLIVHVVKVACRLG
jgi:hypothetical protein